MNKLKIAMMRAQDLRRTEMEEDALAIPREGSSPALAPAQIARAVPDVAGDPVAPERAPLKRDVVPLAELGGADRTTDQVRLLRTRLLESVESLGGMSVLVTSPLRGEGKSYAARHLAVSLALEIGCPTVLVDAHPAGAPRDSVSSMPPANGLLQCLAGETSVSEALLNSDVSNLQYLPAGRPRDGMLPPDGLGVGAVLRQLRAHCEKAALIIDGPGVLDRRDAMLYGRFVDRILMVVRRDHTRLKDLQRAVALLERERLLGIVYNAGGD